MNLSSDVKISRPMAAQAAGTTDINGTAVDMSGYDGVLFLFLLGTITATAVTNIKAQQGALSDGSDAADITGATKSVADNDDDRVGWIDVYQPASRYVRPVVDRGTANAVIDGVVALQYQSKSGPVSNVLSSGLAILGGTLKVGG